MRLEEQLYLFMVKRVLGKQPTKRLLWELPDSEVMKIAAEAPDHSVIQRGAQDGGGTGRHIGASAGAEFPLWWVWCLGLGCSSVKTCSHAPIKCTSGEIGDHQEARLESGRHSKAALDAEHRRAREEERR